MMLAGFCHCFFEPFCPCISCSVCIVACVCVCVGGMANACYPNIVQLFILFFWGALWWQVAIISEHLKKYWAKNGWQYMMYMQCWLRNDFFNKMVRAKKQLMHKPRFSSPVPKMGPGQHMHGRVQFRLSPKTWLAWALRIWKPIAHNALQTERPKSLLELFHVPKSLLDKIPWDWESRTCRTFIFDSKRIRRISIQPQNIRKNYWDKYAVEDIQGTGWLFFWARPSGFQPGVSIGDILILILVHHMVNSLKVGRFDGCEESHETCYSNMSETPVRTSHFWNFHLQKASNGNL